MTTAKAIEYHITRQVMQRRCEGKQGVSTSSGWADRLIAVVAVTAGLFILGTYLQELLWVVIAAATVMALGSIENK